MPRAPAIPAQLHAKYLTFRLGNLVCGLSTLAIREVIGQAELVPSPGAPTCIAGSVHHGGRLAPVIDLRALFGLPARRKQDGSIVAVQCPVDGQVQEAALLVDRIVGVLRLSPAEATLVRDAGSSGPGADFALGVADAGSEKVVLLDECRLLSSGSVREHLA